MTHTSSMTTMRDSETNLILYLIHSIFSLQWHQQTKTNNKQSQQQKLL